MCAIDCYQRALTIFRETSDRHGEGRTLAALATVYQKMRLPGRAAESWQEATAAMHDIGDHEQAAHLEQLASNARTPQRRWWQRTS